MNTKRYIVDNRVFLLGLDELYREAMKEHERDELLSCAKETAKVLSVSPANVPIEGYYTEDEQLSEYFCLMRALQQVSKRHESELGSIDGYKRLKQVTESLIFGPPSDSANLLMGGKDPLSVALKKTLPKWNIENLTNTSYQCALDSNDFSLVALAALSRDPVILTALRESVVLYTEAVGYGFSMGSEGEYVWNVDDPIQTRAMRFVATFNDLFNELLPEPIGVNAEEFWNAYKKRRILGRCVRLGFDDSAQPIKHYHWAIDYDDKNDLVVNDFWDEDIWTTERYRKEKKAR